MLYGSTSYGSAAYGGLVVAVSDATITPVALSASFSTPAATITAQAHVVVTPSVLSASFALPTASVSAGAVVAPGALSATVSHPTATVSAAANVTVTPEVLVLTVSLPMTVASQGPLYAGSGTQEGFTMAVPWSNPGNITSSDDSRASVTIAPVDENSAWLVASEFAFSIPDNATIQGITVEVERSASAANANGWIFSNQARIVKGGTRGSQEKGVSGVIANAWPTTDTYETFGGSSDLWGEMWTPDDINASNFGFALMAAFNASSGPSERAGFVDAIRITAHYLGPSGTVITTSNALITPAVLSLSASTPQAQVNTEAVLSPAAQSIAASIPAYSVVVDEDMTIQPGAAVATFSTPAPTIIAERHVDVQAQALSLTASLPPASASTECVLIPSPLSLAFVLLGPERVGGLWRNAPKTATSWSGQARASTTFSNRSKASTVWDNQAKSPQ